MRAANDSQRRVPRWAAGATAALLALLAVSQLIPDSAPPVRWLTPAEAARLPLDGRPILYDFTAAWCAPCRQLDREVLRNPEVAAAINRNYVPVKVEDRQREEGRNPPEVEALQERFQVRAYPTLVIAAGDGTVHARLEGYPGARAAREFLLDRPGEPSPTGEAAPPTAGQVR